MRVNIAKILLLSECMSDHFYADDTKEGMTEEERAEARRKKKRCVRCCEYTHCFKLSLIV